MSTSKLQRRTSELLSAHLAQYTIRENTRPEWLEGLELDFYVEELGIAIEVQGVQHYRYIPHFHLTPEGFQDQLRRDTIKRDICQVHGIDLFDVASEDDAINIIEKAAGIQVLYEPHPNFVSYMLALQNQVTAQKSRRSRRKHSAKTPYKARTKKDQIHRWENQIIKLQKRIERELANGHETGTLEKAIEKRETKIKNYRMKYQEKLEHRNARKAGRKKIVKAFGNNLYLVWGGRDQHIVWYKEYEDPTSHICDCRNWNAAKNLICNHVFAVAVFLGDRT